jgi:hypothetical protein
MRSFTGIWLEDSHMIVLKLMIAAGALMALAGCVVAPYGNPGYQTGPAFYGDSGYGSSVDIGVYDAHPEGGGGERGGGYGRR